MIAASQCISSGLEGHDSRAQRQDETAAVQHVENGDRLARLALGVERIAAEVDQEERRAEQGEDQNREGRRRDR